MSWFKVDDLLAFNGKVVAAGNEAMGLWVRAGSWCASQLKGGFVPEAMATALAMPLATAYATSDATAAPIESLVSSGLWDRVPGGYVFHDWDDYQPDGATERERRKRRSDAGKRGAAARWGDGNANAVANGIANANRMANADATAMPPSSPVLIPTTPNGVVGGARKRGTRIPDNFVPSEKARETILGEHPHLNLAREHAKFVDYWTAVSGQRGIKLSWDATWRNWMRRAGDEAARNKPRSRQQETDDMFARAMARAEAVDRANGHTPAAIEGVVL